MPSIPWGRLTRTNTKDNRHWCFVSFGEGFVFCILGGEVVVGGCSSHMEGDIRDVFLASVPYGSRDFNIPLAWRVPVFGTANEIRQRRSAWDNPDMKAAKSDF